MIVASLISSLMNRLENKTILCLIQYLEVAQNNFMAYVENVSQQLSCFIEYIKRVYEIDQMLVLSSILSFFATSLNSPIQRHECKILFKI